MLPTLGIELWLNLKNHWMNVRGCLFAQLLRGPLFQGSTPVADLLCLSCNGLAEGSGLIYLARLVPTTSIGNRYLYLHFMSQFKLSETVTRPRLYSFIALIVSVRRH